MTFRSFRHIPCLALVSRLLLAFMLITSDGVFANGLRDEELLDAGTLQRPEAVLAAFPKDREGRTDWVDTLRRGIIAPRETRDGSRRPDTQVAPSEPILFANTREMPHVLFPHQPHTEWLACENCHDALFERKATGRGMGMETILLGGHCGACHGRVAFSPEGSCYRCHVVAHPGSFAPDAAGASPAPAAASPSYTEMTDPGERRPRRRPGAPLGGAPVFPGRPE